MDQCVAPAVLLGVKKLVRWTIALVLGALSLLALPATPKDLRVVWNASPSVPLGVYWIERRSPKAGEIAAVRLPPDVAQLAHRRVYLPNTAVLLKPVAAGFGDRACRFGLRVVIQGRPVAAARWTDRRARAMPHWSGCLKLAPGDLVLLGRSAASFDSRYFGPIHRDRVIGAAMLLWTSGL